MFSKYFKKQSSENHFSEDLKTKNEKHIDEKMVLSQEFADEVISFNYLKKMKFEKRLKKINKKLRNKTVVIYGAGVFFRAIKKYYDLSELNVIAIADSKFEKSTESDFCGYKAINSSEIRDLKPDYVLVATKFYIDIIENLYYKTLKNSKIRIRPLVEKSFLTLLKEVWNKK